MRGRINSSHNTLRKCSCHSEIGSRYKVVGKLDRLEHLQVCFISGKIVGKLKAVWVICKLSQICLIRFTVEISGWSKRCLLALPPTLRIGMVISTVL